MAAPLMAAPLLATGTAHAMPVTTAVSVPPPPQPPVTLPPELDVAPSYQQQTTCDPTPKPGVVAFATMLNDHYGARSYGISRNCNSGVTEHSEGRALDWMINANNAQQKAIADSIVQWLTAPDAQGNLGAMARRFGINYIIWNRQAWRQYAPQRGWVAYTGSSPHTDHIHISFTWDGAYQRTSWWTGVALKTVTVGSSTPGAPAPHAVPVMTSTGYHVLRTGSTGDDVRVLQQALKTGVDGIFGSQTEQAVRAFQTQHDLTVDGIVGTASWTKLIALGLAPARNSSTPTPAPPPAAHPLEQYASQTLRLGSRGAAVTALQGALGGLSADGSFGPLTETKVRAYQKSKELTVDGVVTANMWNALMGKTYTKTAPAAPEPVQPAPSTQPTPPAQPRPPAQSTEAKRALEQYASQTLRLGSRGAAVTALQQALGGLTADGSFGARTDQAVRAFQAEHGLTVDGIVGRQSWAKLIALGSVSSGGTSAPAPTPPAAEKHPLEQYASQTVRRGSTGAAVRALQLALGGLTVDGSFGAATEVRVREYQRSKDLIADGIVGRQTWSALIGT